MNRAAFLFKIKPGLKEEFTEKHKNIWPEVLQAISECGISDYTAFFQKDGSIFVSCKSKNIEESLDKLAGAEAHKKWSKKMEKYIVRDERIKILEELYHID